MSSTDLSAGMARRGRVVLPAAAGVLATAGVLLALYPGAHFGAWAFLPFALPVAIWVALSDMKTMRIPNKAVLALVAVFALVGLAVLPFEEWAWRWTHLGVVLAIGFVMSSLGMMGAGDAKFAAAMAPFVAPADIGRFLMLFAAVTIAAFVTHRLMRRIPAVRRALPDWESWERRDFPMGLALAGALVVYLALAGALELPTSSSRM